MIRVPWLTSVYAAIGLITAALAPTLAVAGGNYGERALRLNAVYADAQEITATSPDGKSKVVISLKHPDANDFEISVSGEIGTGHFTLVSGPNAELLWSPDSRYVVITLNDGGMVGSYLLSVIGQFDGRLAERDLTTLVATEFGHPVKCFERETPNVAGVTWVDQPGRLVAVAQIVPRSNCDAMGTFKAYEIDVAAMKVVRRFSQREAKALFSEALGPELRAAEDCEKRPSVCYIPMLHPEMKQP